MEMTSYGYTSVPGSDALKTRAVGEGPAAELEELDPATPGGRVVAGQWLARCVVRDRFAPVLLEVFDRLALDQEAPEQAVYGHLYRLALGQERNWCRVALKELQQRTHLSERRLNKALAGLVDKGHVRLVERDRRGTLYRVMLPHEVFGEPDHDAVHMARPRKGASSVTAAEPREPHPRAPGAEPQGAAARAPAEEPSTAAAPSGARERARKARGEPVGPGIAPTMPAAVGPKRRRKGVDSNTLLDSSSIGALAGSFLARFGERPGRGRAEVVEEILGRLEEGKALAEVADELSLFGKEAPRSTPVAELARFLERRRG